MLGLVRLDTVPHVDARTVDGSSLGFLGMGLGCRDEWCQ